MSFNNINDILIDLEAKSILSSQDSTSKSEAEIIEQRREISEMRCKMNNSKKGSLNEIDGYDCSKCLNRGSWLESRQSGNFFEEVMVFCRCNRTRNAIRKLQDSGLKAVVKDYRFDNFETTQPWQDKMLSTGKKFVDNYNGKWLFIGGASGSGKSHICTAATIAILKKDNEVKYMLWRDEASRLKSLLNNGTYSEALSYYKTVDVLYIDDLFKTGKAENQEKQRPTSADINLAFEILNNRMIDKKTTIISTECLIEEIIEIDEAIGGRIKQMCGEYCLNIDRDKSKNYRLK